MSGETTASPAAGRLMPRLRRRGGGLGSGRRDSFQKRLFVHGALLIASLIAALPILRVVSVSLRPADQLLERRVVRRHAERQRGSDEDGLCAHQPGQRAGAQRQAADDERDGVDRDGQHDRRGERQGEHPGGCRDEGEQDVALTLARTEAPRVNAVIHEGDNRTRRAPEPRHHVPSVASGRASRAF